MSYKLNTELVNTEAIIEEASSQISDIASDAVSEIVQPIVIPETVINFVNVDQGHNPVLKWFAGDGGETYTVRTTDTQIKPNAGFKIWLVDNSNITFNFYPNYATNFTITANGETVDGHENQIIIQGDQYLTLKAKNGSAYILKVTINNRAASINEVLFNNIVPLGGSDGIDVDGRLSVEGELNASKYNSTDNHLAEISTIAEEYYSNLSAQAGRESNPAALRLVSGSTGYSADWIKGKTTASLLVGTTYFDEIENQEGAGLVLTSHVDGGVYPNDLSTRLFAYANKEGADFPKNDILLNKDGIDIQFYQDDNEPKYINNIKLNKSGIILSSIEDGEEDDYDTMQLSLDAFDIKWSNDGGTTNHSLTKCYNYVLEFVGASTSGSETATIQYAFTGPEYITGSSTTKTGPVA